MAATKKMVVIVALAFGGAFSLIGWGRVTPDDGPRYTNGTNLVRPADYREWPFLGAGLGMTYDSPGDSQAAPSFTNVFVNPSSYRGFMESGVWPNGTVFVLEIRGSGTDAPPNAGGWFQTELQELEAEVKDSRFPDGWAFFNFGPGGSLQSEAAPLEGESAAGCVDCHTNKTAVERTFVQFYRSPERDQI
jgi:hypothetical protein